VFSGLIFVDVWRHGFFFGINADRLNVKNGVLAGYCINSSKRQGKVFVIWWVWYAWDGVIGKAGLVSSYRALKLAALMCLLMCLGSSLS
jgi:hypothetical protein